MPITYTRDDARGRIDVVLTGVVTLADVLAIVDRQADEGTWSYAVYYDARGIARGQSGSPDEARALAQHVAARGKALGPRGPVAVVTDNLAYYAIVRLYSALGASAHFTVEAFRDAGMKVIQLQSPPEWAD